MRGGRFTDCDFTLALFEDADLRDTMFEDCDFEHASFTDCRLQGVEFRRCNLEGAAFRGQDPALFERTDCTGKCNLDKPPENQQETE